MSVRKKVGNSIRPNDKKKIQIVILRDHSVKLGSRPVLFAETKGINWQHYILIAASWIAVGVF